MTCITLLSDPHAEILCGGSGNSNGGGRPSFGGFNPLQGAQFGNVNLAVGLFGPSVGAQQAIQGGGSEENEIEQSIAVYKPYAGHYRPFRRY